MRQCFSELGLLLTSTQEQYAKHPGGSGMPDLNGYFGSPWNREGCGVVTFETTLYFFGR
jgi:hypothetical protein